MDSLISSDLYMKGVRVEVEKPRLTDNILDRGPEQLIAFGVTRWFNDQAEEGVTVVLSPKDAMALSVALDRVLLRGWGMGDDE